MTTSVRGRVVRALAATAIATAVLTSCGSASLENCTKSARVDLSSVAADDPALPFRFPLDNVEKHSQEAAFCEPSRPFPPDKFHAAEDYHRPAGTPVYAMADGEVSFSGPMGGYGWLIIVDHPQANLYSLYGHLSPSRWRMEAGPVMKGDLVAYLGDEWENGGSHDAPLVAHLHFGIRTGQRTDYPGKGEWRWMAGWISPCPRDLGWLQPSVVMAEQHIPSDGFDPPAAGFVEKWWVELLIIASALFGSGWWIVFGIRRNRPWVVLTFSMLLAGVAWYLGTRGVILVAPLFVFAAVSFLVSLCLYGYRLRGGGTDGDET